MFRNSLMGTLFCSCGPVDLFFFLIYCQFAQSILFLEDNGQWAPIITTSTTSTSILSTLSIIGVITIKSGICATSQLWFNINASIAQLRCLRCRIAIVNTIVYAASAPAARQICDATNATEKNNYNIYSLLKE